MQEFFQGTINAITNISIWSIIDILVVSYIFYKGYMLIKETRAEQLLKGILLIIALIPISYLLRLNMLYFILNKTLTIGVLSVVIIFQPEIRRALEQLGQRAFKDSNGHRDVETTEKIVREITTATKNLADTKTGALIAIEKATGLGEILESGTIIDGAISSALLENIFVVNTPLHDGATIIRGNRIHASGCVLPLTKDNTINKKLGTRHRAGIGLSENSDAIIIIVSEETGIISLAIRGRLTRNYDKEKLNTTLMNLMGSKENVRKSASEKVKSWIRDLQKKD
ncbi:diadenylate cyclase CdaA [uncultured Clostridium sp.]|uniref:diadenylate cyclase CdaA n=1 Tax=uncultured Clostridium sp. TaxID=59620 RepID=UPI002622FB21|nr:diadenylate cyclase CdaA [uncultured Clostridium sp.]